MKPIRLEIDGINSYASKQVIDFERLTSRGIFGIFGKTGSGKSTILDAMTLALYGNIARGSKEFINSNRDKASISYTFELGLGQDRVRYMVTRRFKKSERSGKTSATSDYVRLMSKGPDDDYEVLADKVGDVNKQIKAILGLEEGDFLKSVVLPQGRFGEFLSLTGKDRRNMLERIFNLEEYGTDLNVSLARYKRTVGDQINIVQAKLAEYPEVTQEAYKELEEEIKKLEEELKYSRKELVEEKKIYQEYREVHKLSLEKARLEGLEKDLIDQKYSMEDLRSRLEITSTYFGLAEDIKKLEDLDIQLEKISKELDLGEKNYQVIRESIGKENENLLDLERQLKSSMQDTAYKNRVREAYQLKNTKEDLEKDKNDKISLVEDVLTQIKKIDKVLETRQEDLNKLEDQMGNIIDAIIEEEKIKVPSDDQLMDMNTNLHDLGAIISKHEDNEAKSKLLRDRTGKCQDQISQLREGIKDKEKEIGDKKTKLESLVKENNELRLQDLAKDLKNILREGDHLGHACPVCGSKIESLDQGLVANIDLDIYKRNIDEAQADLDSLLQEREKRRLDLGRLETQLSLEKDELDRLELELDKSDIQVLRAKYKAQNDQLEREKSLKNLKEKEIAKLNKEKDKVNRDKSSIEKEIRDLIVDLESRKTRLEVYKDNIDKLEASLKSLEDQLRPLKTDLGTDNIQEAYEEMQRKEEAFDRLNKDISLQEESIEQLKLEEGKMLESCKDLTSQKEATQVRKETILAREEFKDIDRLRQEALSKDDYDQSLIKLEAYDKNILEIGHSIRLVLEGLAGRSVEEEALLQQEGLCKDLEEKLDILKDKLSTLTYQYKKMGQDLDLVASFLKDLANYQTKMDSILDLERVLRGNKFVEYLAQAYLQNIVYDASQRLDLITSGRYALEIDGDYAFVIRDNYKGGLRRSADTLSGGENFLVSLSLALALSSQIQLKGSAPLEFFFLDEGFGSLDRDLLDTVMTSLERLQGENMSVGIISHVEELKNMIPVKLEVEFDEIESSSKVKLSW